MRDKRNIGLIVYPSALITGVSIVMEMFHAAMSINHVQTKLKPDSRLWVLNTSSEQVSGVGGLQIMTDCHIDDAPILESIFVPPIWGNPMSVVNREQRLINWLANQHKLGATLVATGSSACLLASAGLLDGKPATTHWYHFERFAQLYPKVELKTQQFITFDEGIYTAGSINALSDLVLHMIEQEYGKNVSRVVERHFSHEVNRTFERPFFMVGATSHHDEDIVTVQEWIMANWHQNPSLTDMAKQVGMSLRTFTRRFRQSVGETPLNYLQEVKVSKCQELLRDTNLSVSEVAEQAGYKDLGYFSRLFKKATGVTPVQYRRMVRGKSFHAI